MLISASGNHHRELSLRLLRWCHGDFHVLAQRGQEFNQPPNGESACSISRQRRNLRLRYPQDLSSFCLREATLLDDLVDLQRQSRFHQFLLRVRQSKIGKYVAAALSGVDLLRRFIFGRHIPSLRKTGQRLRIFCFPAFQLAGDGRKNK